MRSKNQVAQSCTAGEEGTPTRRELLLESLVVERFTPWFGPLRDKPEVAPPLANGFSCDPIRPAVRAPKYRPGIALGETSQ